MTEIPFSKHFVFPFKKTLLELTSPFPLLVTKQDLRFNLTLLLTSKDEEETKGY
jgi:hypothetical protein